jgi:hypothetical protein
MSVQHCVAPLALRMDQVAENVDAFDRACRIAVRKRRNRGCRAAPSVRQTSAEPEAILAAHDPSLHGRQHATV